MSEHNEAGAAMTGAACPVTVTRDMAVDRLVVRVTSVFAGEQTLAEKLYYIADQKLKGVWT